MTHNQASLNKNITALFWIEVNVLQKFQSQKKGFNRKKGNDHTADG